MRLRAATLAAAMVLVGQNSVALAAQPGVHVDPGSPAGKQYAIPVASARSEAAGQTGSNVSENPPAFGVGITPSPTAPTRHGTSGLSPRRASSETSSKRRHANNASGGSAGPNSQSPTPPGAIQASTTGGSGWLALVLGGMLVLLIGGAGGLLLRRRLS